MKVPCECDRRLPTKVKARPTMLYGRECWAAKDKMQGC